MYREKNDGGYVGIMMVTEQSQKNDAFLHFFGGTETSCKRTTKKKKKTHEYKNQKVK